MTCPDVTCGQVVPPHQVFGCISRRAMRVKLENKTVAVYLSGAADVMRCPTCFYPGFLPARRCTDAMCNQGHVFCGMCGRLPHPPSISCREALTLHHEAISLDEAASDSRLCPHCSAKIIRTSGCDHMHCGFCHSAFNWNDAEHAADSSIALLFNEM